MEFAMPAIDTGMGKYTFITAQPFNPVNHDI